MRPLLALLTATLIVALLTIARPLWAADLRVYYVDAATGMAVVRLEDLQTFVERYNMQLDEIERLRARGTCS